MDGRAPEIEEAEVARGAPRYLGVLVRASMILAAGTLLVGVVGLVVLPQGERCDDLDTMGGGIFLVSGIVFYVALFVGIAVLLRVAWLFSRHRISRGHFGRVAVRVVPAVLVSVAVYLAWGFECLVPGGIGI